MTTNLYFVQYEILCSTYYAGPYNHDEVEYQRHDISGFEGVRNVSIEKAALFYRLKDPLGFCSNFHRAKMFLDGRWWDTVEHLYQAEKTGIIEERDAIWKAKTPKEAREIGQTVHMRNPWDSMKYQAMKKCLILKFTQHQDLLAELLLTGTDVLVEDSPTDYYWGWGVDHKGKNMLGKALMEVRKELAGYSKNNWET